MTEQEALDTAARAAGYGDYKDAIHRAGGGSYTIQSTRAHAASLQRIAGLEAEIERLISDGYGDAALTHRQGERIAELEAKLDALTPSEEDRKLARSMLASWDISNPGTARLLRKYVLQEQPVDPLVEIIESVLSGFETRQHAEAYTVQIREALARRGLSIVKEGV